MKKEGDLGEKVTRVYEDGKWVEYEGEGFGAKRVIATIAAAIAIVGDATIMAMSSYKPNVRTESKIEYRERPTTYTQTDQDYVATGR